MARRARLRGKIGEAVKTRGWCYACEHIHNTAPCRQRVPAATDDPQTWGTFRRCGCPLIAVVGYDPATAAPAQKEKMP